MNYQKISDALNYVPPMTRLITYKDIGLQRYKNLLNLTNWKPTIGGIVMRDCFGDVSIHRKDTTVRYLEELVDFNIRSLYPKTRKLRQYIIDDNRISLNRVKPVRGYTLLDRLKILLKK